MARLPLPAINKANLKVGKKVKLNAWLVFDGIALVIIVGVLAARLSNAGVDYTFMRTASQMSSGSLGRSVAASDYRHISADGVHAETTATVTAAEMAASKQICAEVRANSAKNFVDIQVNGHFANKFVETPGNTTVCVDVNNDKTGGVVYAGTSGDANVYSIYGTK